MGCARFSRSGSAGIAGGISVTRRGARGNRRASIGARYGCCNGSWGVLGARARSRSLNGLSRCVQRSRGWSAGLGWCRWTDSALGRSGRRFGGAGTTMWRGRGSWGRHPPRTFTRTPATRWGMGPRCSSRLGGCSGRKGSFGGSSGRPSSGTMRSRWGSSGPGACCPRTGTGRNAGLGWRRGSW